MQRFVLFLVKSNVKSNQVFTDKEGGLPPIGGHSKLQLRIYVTHNSEGENLYTLPEDILEGKLTEEMTIFVAAQGNNSNIDEAFIVLDNPNLPEPETFFFKLSNL